MATKQKRHRRTNKELGTLDEQIYNALDYDHPQSVRHVFYLMTDPTLPVSVPKTDRGSGNGYMVVQRRLVALRRAGVVPYSWVTDMSRQAYYVNTYRNTAEFLRSVAGNYRAALWEETPHYVEVWAESRSAASVIRDLCKELAVDLYPAGGFSSISFVHQAVEDVAGQIKDNAGGREVMIFYVGDYDRSGMTMDKTLERELRLHLGEKGIPIDFLRVAVNEDQIDAYNLPTKPVKEDEKRATHVKVSVEIEAMPSHVLKGLLRKDIESLLPPGALEVAKVAEENERKFMQGLADGLARKA